MLRSVLALALAAPSLRIEAPIPGKSLVGIEMLNDRNRNIEERSRDRVAVQMAMRALSYSEVESMKHIMAELGGHEGVAVASKVADRVGVTRSVWGTCQSL